LLELHQFDPLELLTTKDLSKLWGIAEITLRIWRLNGCSPRYVKLGRSVKYRRIDVEAWLDARSFASTSEHLL
jgi:predicted DNA-binding transcriptional regulator AlpA